MYEEYRVRRFRLTVTMQPENSSDGCHFCIYPIATGGTVGILPPYAASQPFAKDAVVMYTGTVRQNTLVVDVMCHKVVGWTRQQWDMYPATAYNAIPANAIQIEVNVGWSTIDGAVTSSQIVFVAKLEQEIEWSQPTTLTS